MKQENIRNFCIVAHIDHGKSTLADRFLEVTKSVNKRELKAQLLDSMDLERERGITIKASAVKIIYQAKDGDKYQLNLIDTPGHVDFSYEVSKAIAACEGALLLVDATQGVEAQTVANLYLTFDHNLKIIPVINKIDLQNADIARVTHEITDILGLSQERIMPASAKAGIGIEDILEEIVKVIPPPKGDPQAPLQALIFDSKYDVYKGVIVYICIKNGEIKPGSKVRMMHTGNIYEVKEVGVFSPKPLKVSSLNCGEVGYIVCNIKNAKDVIVGDTVTEEKHPATKALPGYKVVHPMVFCGIYPINSGDYVDLKSAMEKLQLTDSAFIFEAETSIALGFGFRCGFLGLLHMEIIQERITREYDLNILSTTPSVIFKVHGTDGICRDVDNPTRFPESTEIKKTEEPFVKVNIMFPKEYLGEIMELGTNKRGVFVSTEFLDESKVQVLFEMPLAEIITDFYDKIKSITRGYGSMDYEFFDYRESSIVKMDILINGDKCDALSILVHKDKALTKGRALVEKLREEIPRHLFKIALQAVVGGKVLARENVGSMGKDVTSKCYGGDISRKRKLLEKQKEGKKKMKQFGKVQIPQKAFWAALKI
ncbi:MAG: translation elongation factor 4 [Candidatus Omnitrophica bacterium]|nr:translation elongation factor 4 [Candidatus Omnitrophota bacterium]